MSSWVMRTPLPILLAVPTIALAACGSGGSEGNGGTTHSTGTQSGSGGTTAGIGGATGSTTSWMGTTTTGTSPPPPPGCPAAPAGISPEAAQAYTRVNEARVAAGSPCSSVVPALDASAEAHCAYYAGNKGNSQCIASPHVEVSSCASFYAANFDEREKKAGYAGSPSSENMHFVGDPAGAVQGWLDTMYHRYPIIDPWQRDFGYGKAQGCDTMDFGSGASTPADTIAVYPYDGQTGVGTSFYGNESPAPQAPPGGWPSGYPISVHVKGSVDTIQVTKDGSSTPLSTVTAAKLSWQNDAVFFYTEKPLDPGTKYHVHVAGNNGAPFTKDWDFTTAP